MKSQENIEQNKLLSVTDDFSNNQTSVSTPLFLSNKQVSAPSTRTRTRRTRKKKADKNNVSKNNSAVEFIEDTTDLEAR